ncbi:hypothetical protein PGRAT_01110 [Paenibacillus graminis]|uniref:Metallo-beta-lactamase domain-containing protein n=1 Tax=Paenibacillus graminis TaxID=189425 RepID=A0A089LY38_9BACL|nr:hypothetical protein PGRAT_01110 [Paenibacillus graminis]
MLISVQHIRHATSILTIHGKRILVDPMLSDVGELSPVPLTRNYRRKKIKIHNLMRLWIYMVEPRRVEPLSEDNGT